MYGIWLNQPYQQKYITKTREWPNHVPRVITPSVYASYLRFLLVLGTLTVLALLRVLCHFTLQLTYGTDKSRTDCRHIMGIDRGVFVMYFC
eukprot:12083385-Ditylum_brightwellii.AAC.1